MSAGSDINEAGQRIATAKAAGAMRLDQSGPTNLGKLPKEISTLTTLDLACKRRDGPAAPAQIEKASYIPNQNQRVQNPAYRRPLFHRLRRRPRANLV